ncbi:MAG: hypothetical protein R2851_02775 [Caldilineaceae bacterium]
MDQVQQVNDALPDAIDAVSQRLNQMGFQDLLPFLDNVISSMGGISSQLLSLPMAVTDVLLNILVVFFFFALRPHGRAPGPRLHQVSGCRLAPG